MPSNAPSTTHLVGQYVWSTGQWHYTRNLSHTVASYLAAGTVRNGGIAILAPSGTSQATLAAIQEALHIHHGA